MPVRENQKDSIEMRGGSRRTMASTGITDPEPFPRYPSPVLTPAGGGLTCILSLVHRRSDVVLQRLGRDPHMNRIRHDERLAFDRGHDLALRQDSALDDGVPAVDGSLLGGSATSQRSWVQLLLPLAQARAPGTLPRPVPGPPEAPPSCRST